MVKPITPEEVIQQRVNSIPEQVIEIVNQLIVKNWSNHSKSATLKQNAVVNAIVTDMDVSRQQVYDNDWLDFENLYRAQGWTVKYDKPGYNESYEAYFEFRKAPARPGGWSG